MAGTDGVIGMWGAVRGVAAASKNRRRISSECRRTEPPPCKTPGRHVGRDTRSAAADVFDAGDPNYRDRLRKCARYSRGVSEVDRLNWRLKFASVPYPTASAMNAIGCPVLASRAHASPMRIRVM